MKKSLAPLIVIALVVAAIATGIFYQLALGRLGVQAQARSAPPVEAAKLPAKPPVPVGMRAVSVQVGDSGGVLALVKPGSRVDVQAVHTRNHDDAELRTVAEDLEVLASSAPGEQAKLPVVTLLATPAEASLLGLADAAMRLRVTLRNPEDHDKRTPPGAGISSVLQRTGR